MTLEEVKAMSDDDLRITVAEMVGARWMRGAMGYRFLSFAPIRNPEYTDWNFADGSEKLANPHFEGWDIPDYPHDLNAVHEVIVSKWDDDDFWYGYISELEKLTGQDLAKRTRILLHATARQRCEALVLCLSPRQNEAERVQEKTKEKRDKKDTPGIGVEGRCDDCNQKEACLPEHQYCWQCGKLIT